MKKIIKLGLAVAVLLSLNACNDNEDSCDTQGTTKCESDTVYTCDGSKWKVTESCEYGCYANECDEAPVTYRSVDTEAKETWSSGVNEFGVSVQDEIASNQNYIFSPFSLYSALSMVEYGANGETLNQLASALHMNSDRKVAAKTNADLIYNLKADGQHNYSTLALANQIWVEQSFPLEDDFKSTMETVYESPVMQADFLNNLSGAIQSINDWASKKTDGAIPQILGSNDLSEFTKVVLVNAIYFKAKWASEFKKSNTANRTFYNLDGTTEEIPMMYQYTSSNYVSMNGYSAVEVPYRGYKFSMLIVLPDENDGIRNMTLSATDIDNIRKHMFNANVQLTLPKFKIGSTYSENVLSDAMIKIGAKNAFEQDDSSDDAADFSNMTSEYAYINKIIQRAKIEVDEEGTTAAAVTVVEACHSDNCRGEAGYPEVTFTADHPFKFYIVHRDSGAILFAGEFYNK